MSNSPQSVFHHTLFWHCNDVALMRHFYTDLLSLEETFYQNDDATGWLSYQSGSLQIVFIRAEKPQSVLQDWSVQFSYPEGKLHEPSWAIEIPYNDFDPTIERIKLDGSVIYLEEHPREPREGQISFWVRDPVGITIELYTNKPESNS